MSIVQPLQPRDTSPSVLMISPYFPPRKRVGAYRAFRFAIHLKKLGWEPHVVSLDAGNLALTNLQQQLLEGIEVNHLKSIIDNTSSSTSSLSTQKRESTSEKHTNSDVTMDSWYVKAFDRLFPVDTWLLLFLQKRKRVLDLARDVDPDVIWSTADPWSSNLLGRYIAQKMNKPWVADFRDPWTLCDVRGTDRPGVTRWLDRKVEKKILESADRVVFTARETTKLYQAQYSEFADKMTTIYNSYDYTFSGQQAIEITEPQPHAVSPDPRLTLIFFGKFRELSSASIIIEVLGSLKKRMPELEQHLVIKSMGALSERDRAHAESLGVLECFEKSPPVAYEQATERLNREDLLFLSTRRERDEIIPAKLWDYIAANRPILSMTNNSEIAEILEEIQKGKQVRPDDVGEAVELLHESIIAKQRGEPLAIPYAPSPEAREPYTAAATTRQLVALFETLISGN